MRILLIEDNTAFAANVADYLGERGHEVDFARDGVTGLHLSVTNEYDAIVLDLTLPGLDGLSLCTQLRERARSTVPVLMLTARDTIDDKIAGFEAGADDYLVKPFALRELSARLDVMDRRRRRDGRRLTICDLVLDLDTLEASRAGKAISLTPSELKLLEALMKASPAVLSRSALEHLLWQDAPPVSDALRLHIHGLRRAIDRQFRPALLRTVRGRGWAIAEPHAGAT